MPLKFLQAPKLHHLPLPIPPLCNSSSNSLAVKQKISSSLRYQYHHVWTSSPPATPTIRRHRAISASFSPFDLTEDNIKQVLDDSQVELAQLYDASVGITGKAELAELDGPYVKIRLSGKFWHKRSTVLARLGNYLKQKIPEILEVDIEDEKQLDDSPENF